MQFRNKKRMHFVGIGGVGMSGIAEILIHQGFMVSGSDLRESETTKRLAALGAKIFIGHYTSNIEEYSVVITSTAIDPNNPEIIEARRRKIPIIHRSEMLAELVRLKQGIGIAGTHGKTTTSSMLSSLFFSCGLNPTAIVGGKVLNFGSNARGGGGQYIVFEADESDGSFLKLLPVISIVTNIDADHLDFYKYFEGVKDAFLHYINNIPFYGFSVICIDDPAIASIEEQIERPYVTYGFSERAEFRAADVRFEDGFTVYDCYCGKEKLGEVRLRLLGRHNVLNSLAVVAVARELQISFGAITSGLAEFKGVGRRIEFVGEKNGITAIDDYGHHPTEIRATLSAIKTLNRRIVAVFQPHRYTRTQLLWEDFGKSFSDCDRLIIAGIYPAGESPIEGVSSRMIADVYDKHSDEKCMVIQNFEDIPSAVAAVLQPGDIVLTLGAGDIYKAGPKILECLNG